MPLKYGRKPQRFDDRIPKLTDLIADRTMLPPPPTSIDWTARLEGKNLGMMLNDTLGDCTCAALGHARQLWTANVGPQMLTPPDKFIEQFYEESCGYKPGDPSTDDGGDEQTVLTCAMKKGLPTNRGRDRLAAFVEVDPKNIDDVKRTIVDCGLIYIGFNVPAFLENLEDPGATWDVDPEADNTIVGGHAVILGAYDETGATLVSWGALYRMTWAFWGQFVDECYALANKDWIATTGRSPGGLTLAELETQMKALK